MNCANCGKKIVYGEKYLPAYSVNIWFVEEHPTKNGVERELTRADAICWRCLEEVAKYCEE